MSNGYVARIEKQHEILNGFTGTNWIPGAEFWVTNGTVEFTIPKAVDYEVAGLHSAREFQRGFNFRMTS